LFEFKQKRTHFKIEQIFVVFSTKFCVANKFFLRIFWKILFATQIFVEKTTKICSILKCVRFCLNSNKIYTFIFYSDSNIEGLMGLVYRFSNILKHCFSWFLEKFQEFHLKSKITKKKIHLTSILYQLCLSDDPQFS
jgi:hypothetical protein